MQTTQQLFNQRAKKLSLALLFIISNLALGLAQDRYVDYGLNLYPHLSNRRLVAFDEYAQSEVDSLERYESARPSLGLGFYLNYRALKVGIRTGVNYMQVGYTGERQAIPLNDPLASEFTDFKKDFVSHQIEVPFSLLFYQQLSPKDEFYFLLGSGLSLNIANRDVFTRYEGSVSEKERVKPEEDFRAVNVCIQTGLGWERQISRQLRMGVAPVFKLWLSGLYTDEILNRNIYQMGINLSFSLHQKVEYID